MYNIEVKRSVVKALNHIPREDQVKIGQLIKKLANNPRPAQSVKLSGSTYYRIRSGDYRIIYDIQDETLMIMILKLGHRREVYR